VDWNLFEKISLTYVGCALASNLIIVPYMNRSPLEQVAEHIFAER
jgi:hypothetical protein